MKVKDVYVFTVHHRWYKNPTFPDWETWQKELVTDFQQSFYVGLFSCPKSTSEELLTFLSIYQRYLFLKAAQ